MPIKAVGDKGEFRLVCINKHTDEDTMLVWDDPVYIPIATINTQGVKLRLYCCSVCQYVELYLGKKP